ncbi:helix-turn-helix transcriptional regulator [Fusibacter sp. JL216-2]|uniref:helix-turn-helix transcriptional regulator n=1 Tax=Fusibacter sp. JL216-2 TaxID=3071453 RepID=UPI003D336BCD
MRLERLLAIVMYLLNRKRATAKELARHFEVSVRTIQRDVDALSAAGFPVFAWQGRQGGYELLDTFKMDRNFLTSQELEILRTLLRGIESTYTDENIRRLISKFEYMDHVRPKAWDKIESGIVQIDLSGWGGQEALSDKLSLLRSATEQKRIIGFSYANVKGEITRRSVEPIKLILKSNQWYLFGYCLVREDYRVFKIGRITDLKVLDTVYERQHERDIPNLNDTYEIDTRPQIKLILRFHPSALGQASDFFGFELIRKDSQGFYIVEVTYPEDEWVYGMILSFGDKVEVLEPDHIGKIIKAKAEKIISTYL